MKLIKAQGRAVAVAKNIDMAHSVVDMLVEAEGANGGNLITWVGDAIESDIRRVEFDQRCDDCGLVWNSAILGDGSEACPYCGSIMVDGVAE